MCRVDLDERLYHLKGGGPEPRVVRVANFTIHRQLMQLRGGGDVSKRVLSS